MKIKPEDMITDCAVADAKEPKVADFKQHLAEAGYPNASDEDILSYALFPQVALEFFKKNR